MRWGNGRADSSKAGVKERVAEAMAEGDTVTTTSFGFERVTPMSPAQISAKLGISIAHVRSSQQRIRRDLGAQATEADLGWRP